MRSKVLSSGIRIEDNRSINCGISITNQNNPYFMLWYNSIQNEFGFKPKYYTQSPTYLYMNDLNQYINALADIIQAMAEANEFVTGDNVKVLCDVAVSRYFTFNLQLMFNKGNNAKFCTSPAIAQNTCYSLLFLIKWK